MTRKTTGLLAALMMTAVAAPVAAQEVTLRLADSLPVGHYMTTGVADPLMAKTKEMTGDKVAFEHFPAEQLGKAKDMLSLVQSGVADIAYVGASYSADKLPLSSVGELPEAFSNSCEGTKAFWSVAKPGGALDVAEYQPEGVRALAVLVLSPYQLFVHGDLAGIGDVNGMKVRVTGAPKIAAIQKLGGVPVNVPGPEAREALSRGTVDAIAFPIASIKPYDLAPHIKTATKGLNFGSFVATWMISQAKYDSLPEDVQKALTEAGEAATLNGCEATDASTEEDFKFVAEQGVTFVDLPAADLDTLQGVMSSVGDEWAADLDGRGKPGTDILNAFRAGLKSE
ncbi:C4-dicarboxylate ABC transporter [Primorskyibacter flagellatus]|uniref:C4-dicarboxylate ABC transporter n=1 Tax=Primorskyibacter flagellatus TaxID=1387277 RepID=A0A917AE61_9RHOB|nr:TRAP transporter substrate-binding protein DctP [Primorskyibacter flagellatus]GGE44723.1 C4-dicarboxylate ABC transporter [Primorskyibacter flagellatus]